MGNLLRLVLFVLDGQRFAVPLQSVDRAVSAVEVTPLPGAPAIVRGLIDLHGEVVPVFDMRKRSADAAFDIQASDQFLILRTQSRKVGLLVQQTLGVFDLDAAPLAPGDDNSVPGFEGVTRLEESMILIHDVERFLSPAENVVLAHAEENGA